MKSLFRNPFFKMIQDRWHWAAIWTALAWGLGGLDGLRYAMYANAVVAGMVGSVFIIACTKALYGNTKTAEERKKGKYRFLCPSCLHFGAFLCECGNCKTLVELFQMDTRGEFNPACVECETIIFPDKIKASCDKCLRSSDAEIHHHRKVEILATLNAKDFQELLNASGAKEQYSHRIKDFFFHGENQVLKYVLNFDSSNPPEILDEYYDAWKWIDYVWLDLQQSDSLEVARQLDALLRINELKEMKPDLFQIERQIGAMMSSYALAWNKRRIKVFVRQEQIDPILCLRLEQQFGEVQYGVAPEELFSVLARPALGAPQDELIIESRGNRIPQNQEG